MTRKIKTVPRIESLKRAFNFVENPIPVVDHALKTYGDTYYTRIIGGRKIVMSIEPGFAQHVLQKGNKKYEKSELQTDALGKYVGYGLLTANGEYWLRQRRLIQPGFHKAKLAALVGIMTEEISKFYDDLEERVIQDPNIDVSHAMMELTLRVVAKSLFSTGINEEDIIKLGSWISDIQKHIVKEVRMPIFNFWRRLNGQTRKALGLADHAKKMIQDLIDERKRSEEKYGDLLDMLLDSKYEDTGESMSDEQILDEAIILFVAGYETTAIALAWCLHALREDPGVRAKLESEVMDQTGEYAMESLMRPSYLGQVIDETLRKYPSAWILDRIALEDDEIDGVKINKGDLVGLYVFGVHRNPKIWPEPDVFNPDRFHPSNKKSQISYSFFPFGGGPRMCIGYHFAYMEMRIAIAEFMKRFVLPQPTGHEPDYLPLITLKPRENIVMKLKRRQEEEQMDEEVHAGVTVHES